MMLHQLTGTATLSKGTIMSFQVIFSCLKSLLYHTRDPMLVSKGSFDFKRRCTEWSVYDIKVPREPFESIGSVCSLIALAVL